MRGEGTRDHAREPSAATGERQAPAERGARAVPAQAAPGQAVTGGDRIAKALARAGVASRREVERLIAEGRVALNGRVLDTPAVKIAPGDVLSVDGKAVEAPEPARVWRHHKPPGLLTTHNDPKGRRTVFDALPPGMPRVISVGRLDLNSEGLLLLTNDGGLARALELPSSGWVRRYRARARGRVTQARLDALRDGATIEGVDYGPIDARLDEVKAGAGAGAGRGPPPANIWLSVAIAEGKNREVRRVLEHLGLRVNRLIRVAYGPFELGALAPGAVEEVASRAVRALSKGEVPPSKPGAEATSQGPRPLRARPGSGAEDKAAPAHTRARRLSPAPKRSAGPPAGKTPAEPAKRAYKPGWARPKPKVPSPAGKGGRRPRREPPA